MSLHDDIANQIQNLKTKMPASLAKRLYLCGGTAAFLLGSDRPFSGDLDFMIPETLTRVAEKALKTRFKKNLKKPVFHSQVAHIAGKGMTVDLIARSGLLPAGCRKSFSFYLTPAIERKKTIVRSGGRQFICIPVELLVLIKWLAGRGKELGKYDLYDAFRILKKTKKIRAAFLKELILKFCRPLSAARPILKRYVKKIGQYGAREARILTRILESIE